MRYRESRVLCTASRRVASQFNKHRSVKYRSNCRAGCVGQPSLDGEVWIWDTYPLHLKHIYIVFKALPPPKPHKRRSPKLSHGSACNVHHVSLAGPARLTQTFNGGVFGLHLSSSKVRFSCPASVIVPNFGRFRYCTRSWPPCWHVNNLSLSFLWRSKCTFNPPQNFSVISGFPQFK